MNQIRLSSIIPKSSCKFINQDVCKYFQKDFKTNVALQDFQQTKIPNTILNVTGDVPSVYATYYKLFNYLNRGYYIDNMNPELRQHYVRGLDKIFNPFFVIPKSYREMLKLDNKDKITRFKSQHGNCSLFVFDKTFPDLNYELWRFNSSEATNFLGFAFLNSTKTWEHFEVEKQTQQEQEHGLSTIKDEELVEKKLIVSKKLIKHYQDNPVKFTHLIKNYLCDFQIDWQKVDNLVSTEAEDELITITGVEEMCTAVESLVRLHSRELVF